jgi:hypothetical protein
LGRTLVLLSQNDQDFTFAAEVASVAGLSLKKAASVEDAVQPLAAGEHPILMVDLTSLELLSQFEQELQSKVGLFSELVNGNTFHFISDEDFDECSWLPESPLMGSFILRNFKDPRGAGTRYGRLVAATLQERAYGIKNLLGPSAQVQTVRLGRSSQKMEAVEAVRGYAVAAGFNNRMASTIANAVDEILMNAIFDAPVDALGKQEKAMMPRTEDFALEGRHLVEMEIGFDGKTIGIAAIDHFGSIDKTRILRHISKVYSTENYKLKSTSAGAGIGLSSVFQGGASFFYVCESGARTEAMVFFSLTESYREFREQFRFLVTQFYF